MLVPIKIYLSAIVMKKIILIFVFLLLATDSYVFAKSILTKISTEKQKDNITIHLFFDLTPKYAVKQTGRRVDLILDHSLVNDSSLHFITDEDIVKFLPLVSEDRTTLSFFLRYKPQQVNVTVGKNNSLILSIEPGNDNLKTRTDIVTDLEKAPTANGADNQYANPLQLSPYAHDWRLFFSRYESKVVIKAPIQYTLPPFPIISLLPPDLEKNLKLIPSQVNNLASTGQWNAMEPLVADMLRVENNVEKKKKLALTYGEILLRAGNFSGAYKQLYLLKHTYAHQPIGLFAGFLLAKLQAEFQDPNLGDYNLQQLASSFASDNPLTPYFLLLQIETSLATDQLPKMKALLDRDDVPYPDHLEKIKELRQADYWYAEHNFIKAYVGYKLLDDPALIEHHYYSLNAYCDTLYRQKMFQQSAVCYQNLASHITDKSQLGMVDYRKSMSELHFKRDYEMMTSFSTLADAFSGTDAGYKAAIKRNDIRFLTKKNWEAGTSRSYKNIADKAANRGTSEEAAFKEALVYKLIGKDDKCIDLLMTFLRNYRSGDLIETAQALLIDTLPGELKRLIDEKKYVEALVLAKKNDRLFRKKWIDRSLLADIAVAYQNLGLFKESENTYLYLMDIDGKNAERKYLLPLIQSLFHQGNYKAVSDYAEKYSQIFPNGDNSRKILMLRLQALKNDNKIAEAIALLPAPLPDDPAFLELAANLHYLNNDYKQAAQILSTLQQNKQPLSDYFRFVLAESLYKQGEYDKAAGVYTTLENASSFQDQSLFRLANIASKNGEKEKTVKLLQQIVEKGKDPLWKNLAQKELEYEKIVNNL